MDIGPTSISPPAPAFSFLRNYFLVVVGSSEDVVSQLNFLS